MGLYKTKKKTKKNNRKTKKNYYKLIGGSKLGALKKLAKAKSGSSPQMKNIQNQIAAKTTAQGSSPVKAPSLGAAQTPAPGPANTKTETPKKAQSLLASTQGESKMATNFKKDVNKTKLKAIRKIKRKINDLMANLSGYFVMNVLKEICQESGNCSESIKKQFFKVCIPDNFKNYSKEIESISVDYKYSKDEPLKKPVNTNIKNSVYGDKKGFDNKIGKKTTDFDQCKKVIDSNFKSCVDLLALLSLGIYKTLFAFSNFKDLSKPKIFPSNCNIKGLKKKSTNVIFSEIFDNKTFEKLGKKTKNAIHNLSKTQFKGLEEAILSNNSKKVAIILSGVSANAIPSSSIPSSSISSGPIPASKNKNNKPNNKKSNKKKQNGTSSKETSSKETSSNGTSSNGTSSKETSSNGTTPKETSSKKNKSKRSFFKGSSSGSTLGFLALGT